MRRRRLAQGLDWIVIEWTSLEEPDHPRDPDAPRVKVSWCKQGIGGASDIRCQSLVEAIQTGNRLVNEAKQDGYAEQQHRAALLQLEMHPAAKVSNLTNRQTHVVEQIVTVQCRRIGGASIWRNGEGIDSQEIAGAEQSGIRFRGLVKNVAVELTDIRVEPTIRLTVVADWVGTGFLNGTPAKRTQPAMQVAQPTAVAAAPTVVQPSPRPAKSKPKKFTINRAIRLDDDE